MYIPHQAEIENLYQGFGTTSLSLSSNDFDIVPLQMRFIEMSASAGCDSCSADYTPAAIDHGSRVDHAFAGCKVSDLQREGDFQLAAGTDTCV